MFSIKITSNQKAIWQKSTFEIEREIILFSTYFGPKSNPNLSDKDSDPANVLIGPSLLGNRLSRYLVKGLLLITTDKKADMHIEDSLYFKKSFVRYNLKYEIALKIPKLFNIKLISTQLKKNSVQIGCNFT